MKIAYIHDDKKINTGAQYINDLIVVKLREFNIFVKNVYPRSRLIDNSHINLRGVANILFFYSLLEQKKEILKYDLIQGTTYTPLTFFPFDIPVVSHFGSTTKGFLLSVPKTKNVEDGLFSIWKKLKKDRVISEIDISTKKPLEDISDIEFFAAAKADKVIATSKIVKENLVKEGKISSNKIVVVHNAIEDYWFDKDIAPLSPPKLVFLGRIGVDVFTWKIKGLDRLIKIYGYFPNLEKVTIAMSTNKKIAAWLNRNIQKHVAMFNVPKEKIKDILYPLRGSVFILSSRYEGFSLSLVEAMSQGLIPVAYPVGIVPEIIENGRNGYIVNSTKEAEERIKQILSNEDLRFYLSRESHQTSQKFKAEIMARKLVELYKGITKKPVRVPATKARLHTEPRHSRAFVKS